MIMNRKQREFYDINLKKILNARRDNNHIFADRLEKINRLLADNNTPQALVLADKYQFSLDFIHSVKMLFGGFGD